LSCCQKFGIDDDDRTWTGNVLQMIVFSFLFLGQELISYISDGPNQKGVKLPIYSRPLYYLGILVLFLLEQPFLYLIQKPNVPHFKPDHDDIWHDCSSVCKYALAGKYALTVKPFEFQRMSEMACTPYSFFSKFTSLFTALIIVLYSDIVT